MKAKPKQPEIKKGTTFTGWAIFNWGICLDTVFRTRKGAIEYLVSSRGRGGRPNTWKDVRKYCRVEKVKCTVIK